MPDDVITDIAQINMDWLNAVLVRSDALRVGRVRNFDVEPSASDNARRSRIHVHYSPDAVGKRPEFLWLKMCSGCHGFVGQSG